MTVTEHEHEALTALRNQKTLVDLLESYVDDSGLTNTYCEGCGRHAPMEDAPGYTGCARIAGPIRHESQCLDGIAHAAVTAARERGAAIPALEALLADYATVRKELKAVVDLVSSDGHGFHDGTHMGRWLRRARAALAKKGDA